MQPTFQGHIIFFYFIVSADIGVTNPDVNVAAGTSVTFDDVRGVCMI